jgi:hypothetical protein
MNNRGMKALRDWKLRAVAEPFVDLDVPEKLSALAHDGRLPALDG